VMSSRRHLAFVEFFGYFGVLLQVWWIFRWTNAKYLQIEGSFVLPFF
jgi:hypothetical protein